MAEQYLINDTTLTSIADAIRERSNDTKQYLPREMPPAIRGILGGETAGVEELITRDITHYWDVLGSITSIRSYAFRGCSYLSMVSLPACTFIGLSAFKGTANQMSMYLLGDSVPELADTPSMIFESNTRFYVWASMVDAFIDEGYGTATGGSSVNGRTVTAFDGQDGGYYDTLQLLTPTQVINAVRAHEAL